MKIDNLPSALRALLTDESAQWTPDCPETEQWIDFVEQGEEYPRYETMLTHLENCNYCLQEHHLVRQVIVLRNLKEPDWAERLRKLLEELIGGAWVKPVHAISEVFNKALQNQSPTRALGMRSKKQSEMQKAAAPVETFVRTTQPTLRWKSLSASASYVLAVMEQSQTNPLYYEQEVGKQTEYTLPLEAGIEAGKVYRWQITASTQNHPVFTTWFAVLSPELQREVEQLEGRADSPLAQIGIYEAYGLYDEALQKAMGEGNDNANMIAIRAELERRFIR